MSENALQLVLPTLCVPLFSLYLQLLERLQGLLSVGLLEDTNKGIDDEDEEDDKGLHKGRDGDCIAIVLLEPCQAKGHHCSKQQNTNLGWWW